MKMASVVLLSFSGYFELRRQMLYKTEGEWCYEKKKRWKSDVRNSGFGTISRSDVQNAICQVCDSLIV